MPTSAPSGEPEPTHGRRDARGHATRHAESGHLPAEVPGRTAPRGWARRRPRQVFGLVARIACDPPTVRRFPAARAGLASAGDGGRSTYRCGAAPALDLAVRTGFPFNSSLYLDKAMKPWPAHVTPGTGRRQAGSSLRRSRSATAQVIPFLCPEAGPAAASAIRDASGATTSPDTRAREESAPARRRHRFAESLRAVPRFAEKNGRR